MIYGYARVSTKGQARDGNSLDAQEKALRAAGAETIYTDVYSGAKIDRPQFKELLERIDSGDTLIVTKLDRFARSITQGSELIETLINKGVRVHILNLGVLDNTPASKLVRNVFLSFAEFERELIKERMQDGKAIARQSPTYREGRPKKYSKPQIEHALTLLADHSFTQVETLTGISKSTLIRARRERGVS